jgi:hypothetical protein
MLKSISRGTPVKLGSQMPVDNVAKCHKVEDRSHGVTVIFHLVRRYRAQLQPLVLPHPSHT